MDKINKLCEILDNSNSTEIIPHIDELNRMVDNEKEILKQLLESIESVDMIDTFKIPSKYKKLSIEELEIMFNDTVDINDKISIYYTMNKKITTISNLII